LSPSLTCTGSPTPKQQSRFRNLGGYFPQYSTPSASLYKNHLTKESLRFLPSKALREQTSFKLCLPQMITMCHQHTQCFGVQYIVLLRGVYRSKNHSNGDTEVYYWGRYSFGLLFIQTFSSYVSEVIRKGSEIQNKRRHPLCLWKVTWRKRRGWPANDHSKHSAIGTQKEKIRKPKT
jgi:hypothetical protein